MSGRSFRYIYTAADERIAAVERKPAGDNRTTFTIRGLDNHLLNTWVDDWNGSP